MSTSTQQPPAPVPPPATAPPSPPAPLPAWVPRAILLAVAAFFGILVTRFLVHRLQSLILMVVVALFLSFALEPAVTWLAARGWRRGAATGVVMLGLLLGGGVLVGAMVPMLVQQVEGLTAGLPGWLDRANRLTERWLGTSVTTSQLQRTLTSSTSDLAGSLLTVGTTLASGFFKLLTVGLFAFYLVADGPRVRRAVCSVLPPQRQREMLWAWDVAIAKTGGYLYSRLLLAAISAAATFAVLVLLGVPFALPLALWVGIISQFIPVVGTYIALTVPVLVALAHSPVAAVVLLVFLVLYQQVENYLLGPRVTARTMALHPAVALGAVIAGGSLYGAIGAFLALPAAAILQAGLSTYLTRHEVLDSALTRPRRP